VPQELGGVAGDLSGGALLLAAAGAQPAGPLVKRRVTGVVVHLQVQGRLSAARKIFDHADDLADACSRPDSSREARRQARGSLPPRN
jgi:hypothetical protein